MKNTNTDAENVNVSNASELTQLDAELSEAIWQWKASRVFRVLRQGANANMTFNGSPLLNHAVVWCSPDLVFAMVEHGANPNASNIWKITPLQVASAAGRCAIISALLECGAEIEAVSSAGHTALYDAVINKETAAARLLLEAGANPNFLGPDGQTLLQWAGAHGGTRMPCNLIKHGADINQKGPGGVTALHVAAFHENLAVARVFLRHGAEVNAQDADGEAALHRATSMGSAALVSLLLRHGANPNASDNRGRTPLHLAAPSEDVTIVRILLKAGADPGIKDSRGNNPLLYTVERSRGNGGSAAVAMLQAGATASKAALEKMLVNTVRRAPVIEDCDVLVSELLRRQISPHRLTEGDFRRMLTARMIVDQVTLPRKVHKLVEELTAHGVAVPPFVIAALL